MPFNWQAPPSLENGTIGDLMMRGPDALAQAAVNAGRARANATSQNGQIWGNAIANVGQTVAAIPQQMQQAKQQEQQTALRQIQLDDATRQQQGHKAMSSIMSGGLNPGDAGPQESYLSEDGLFDVKKITASLAEGGFGDQASDLVKGAESINDSILKHQKLEVEAGNLHTVLMGDMADGALKLVKRGMPLDQAIQFVAAPAVATKRIKPEELQQVTEHLMSLPPEQQEAALDSLRDAASQIDKGENLAKDSERIDRYGRVKASNIVAPPKHYESKSVLLNGNRAEVSYDPSSGKYLDASGADVTAHVAPLPAASKGKEAKSVLLDGKPAEVVFDPETGKYADASGADVSARVKPIPAAAITIRNEAAAAAANAPAIDSARPTGPTANKVNASTGLTPNAEFQGALSFGLTGQLPSAGLSSTGQRLAAQQIIQNKASAIAASAGVDLPTVRAEYKANSGTLSKLLPQATATANAANTSIDNLDLAIQKSPEVARTGSKLVNKYTQWAQGNLTPASGLSQLETYIYTAAREYAKVTSGGAASVQGLTDSAAKEAEKLINAAQSPETLDAVAQAMKNDMGNVMKEQTNGLNRVSNTIANFFSAANGFGPVGAASAAQPTKKTADELIKQYGR